MTTLANLQTQYESLPSDACDRLERLLDIFGHHLVWTRDLVLSKLKARVSSPDNRRALGDESRAIYDKISAGLKRGRTLFPRKRGASPLFPRGRGLI